MNAVCTPFAFFRSLLACSLALAIAIGLAGCDSQPPTSALPDASAVSDASSLVQQDASPFAVLSTPVTREAGQTNNEAASASASFGLIQGLAVAPNQDILVADLFAGLGSSAAGLEMPLFGATDLSPIGRRSLWATVGPVTDDTGCVVGETTFQNCGQALYRVSQGRTRLVADLFAFEAEHNPDGLGIDSNPYDVEALKGRGALVVDAAGNDLLRVDNRGRVDVVAFFPQAAPEAVPTSVAVGPDGAYFVGELTGFPATPGVSSIWRIAPGASNAACGTSADCQKVFNGGFTSIIDLAFGPDGDLYVAELDESSWLAFVPGGPAPTGGTINKCAVETGTCEEVATGIFFLTAITFDDDGALWATTSFGAEVQPLQP